VQGGAGGEGRFQMVKIKFQGVSRRKENGIGEHARREKSAQKVGYVKNELVKGQSSLSKWSLTAHFTVEALFKKVCL